VAGFVSGDGCFRISIRKFNKNNVYITLIFILTQHAKDKLLLYHLIEFFGCGHVYIYSSYGEFKCQSFIDNYEKILSFFIKYNILGTKLLDFED
jgi:hypothetical protein